MRLPDQCPGEKATATRITIDRHRRTTTVLVAVATLPTGDAAPAQPATRTPAPTVRTLVREAPPLYGQLVNGEWVMVRRDHPFFVGHGGVRNLWPDGDYRLKNGSRLPVLAAHIVPPWVKQGFNPQPEPPGKELSAMATGGRPIVISGGRFFLAGEGGAQTPYPDGVYALVRGGSGRVAGGGDPQPGPRSGVRPPRVGLSGSCSPPAVRG